MNPSLFRQKTFWLSIGSLFACCLLTPGTVSAQAIQLPTVGFFQISTTVSAPDAGRSHLGGISGYGGGLNSRGVPGMSHLPLANRAFRNQAIGNNAFNRNAGVTVRIISLREQEAEVMAEADRLMSIRREVNPNGSRETRRRADFINRHVGRRR